MSNQNRFLLPHTSANSSSGATSASSSSSTTNAKTNQPESDPLKSINDDDNQHSVDTDFDSYWEEEARNPHRNRIRIGRQYQASVPTLLKSGEKDLRKLEELETLSFCPKKSAKVSDAELDHYFTVAKSLNLFASLVDTRSLLGRDVTIADLNHIRHKEGLSLASVIQPVRQTTTSSSPPSSQQQISSSSSSSSASILNSATANSPNKSPQTTDCDNNTTTTTKQQASLSTTTSSQSSPKENVENNYAFNQPFMKALSHFINLHHPCHHDQECKKLLKDIPLEDDSGPIVSITAGNLRQGTTAASTSSKSESKPGRSRSSLKQLMIKEETEKAAPTTSTDQQQDQDQQQQGGDVVASNAIQSPTFEEWTREEVELFSKAIEVCGKNFSSIKKGFLPSKSVKSIVEYYYIGSRDVSDNKKKSSQNVEASDGCSSPEKSLANNNGGQGGSGSSGSSSAGGKGNNGAASTTTTATSSSRTTTTSGTSSNNNNNNNETTNNTSKLNDELITNTSKQSNRATPSNKNNNKQSKSATATPDQQDSSNGAGGANVTRKQTKNIDARMSVYNFDEESNRDESPIRFDCPRPGAEVKPLKAKPILPNNVDSDATNSNVGSLKFFMDGQLVLKLNACQDQQSGEGIEKCHWVENKMVGNATRQKRYTKRSSDKASSESYNNGSQSNSVVSSYQEDDSKNEDLTNDEDSKESANSFTNLPQQQPSQQQQQQQKNQQHGSPSPKRHKVKNEANNNNSSSNNNNNQAQLSPFLQQHLPSPIDYNRVAVNNRIKERNETTNNLSNPSPVISQAMPWFQANSFAVAAALLSGLPFPPNAANSMMDSASIPPAPISAQQQSNVNLASTKPMDLSLEHSSPKSLQKSGRSSRSKPKNNN